MTKKQKMWNVYLPACYYEVFTVEARTKKEAIEKVINCDLNVLQNCTLSNKTWSRRKHAVLLDKNNTEIYGK